MESEQTKRLQRTPDGSYIAELEELSHRLDALEAAHNTLAVDVEDMKPHDASGYTLPKDQPVKCPHCGVEVSGRTWNMSCPMCGVIMLPATETVGERIATKCAFWEKRGECAAAIDAAVKAANDRDNYKDAFDVLREDHNALCEGLNAALDAHGVKWKDASTYVGFMESALSRAEKAEAEVKRLSDPGWITRMSCPNSTYAAFARHVRGGGA